MTAQVMKMYTFVEVWTQSSDETVSASCTMSGIINEANSPRARKVSLGMATEMFLRKQNVWLTQRVEFIY